MTFASYLPLCLLAWPLLAFGPDDRLASLTVDHWGASHGIPEETVAMLLAPGDGYVWLAANHGLIRFDGNRAQVFRLGDLFRAKGTGSCSSNTVNALLQGTDGHLWAGAGSGCIFQIRRDRFGGFANFRVVAMESPIQSRPEASVRALRNSPDGRRIEVVRYSSSSEIDPTVAGRLSLAAPSSSPSLEKQILPSPTGGRIYHSKRSPAGVLWGVTPAGELYSVPPGRDRWVPAPGAPALGNVERILPDRTGAVWIVTDRGLLRYRDGSVRAFTPAQGRVPQRVLSLLEDHAGCLWMGAPQSISRLCGDRLESIPVGVNEEELMVSLAEDPHGNLWLGGNWGNLYRLSRPIFRSYTRGNGAPESHFTGVTADRQGHIWGSTTKSALIRIVGGNIVANPVTSEIASTEALLPHPLGGVLAANKHGALFHVTELAVRPLPIRPPLVLGPVPALAWEAADTLLFSNALGNHRLRLQPDGLWVPESLAGPQRIRQWAQQGGRTWALAQYTGLYLLEGSVYHAAPNSQPEKARAWYSLMSDRAGLLWIGTTDGVEVYSPAEGRFLTARPLLFGDQIFHISEDRFGKLWCATRQGLVRFDRAQALAVAAGGPPDRFFFERYGDAQALPTTNFGLVTSATGATGPDGRIWFPGLLGLISLQPADFEAVPRPPTAVLRQVNSDGTAQDLNTPLRIAPGAKTLEFLFQTLRFGPLGGDFCRFRLEGFNPSWQSCNEARSVQYTALPPGQYQFAVQTSSQAGRWNGSVLRVPVTLEPAFHQLLWARLLAVAALIAALGFLAWRRQKQLLDRNRWLAEKVDERTATLAQATVAAESANRAKSEFLATMSHEIRTPMNGVLGAVQILDESPLDRDQKKLVSVIRQSGEDLVGIVDDILCLAKVESGKLSLERAAVPVRPLGESLVALFQPKARSKGVSLTLEVHPAVPDFILSDPQRLRQILLNLLGNAVKFTERGRVTLRVTLDGEMITFEVHDTGLGIPAAAIPTLFDPFVQADSSTTRRFGGSGLGLSIVHRLAVAMGGRVDVKSEVGRGSIFRVDLPLEAATPPSDEDLPASPSALESSGMRVLLVEDNPVNQMISQKMLIRLGCAVVVAGDGLQALQALRSSQIDLVLMDCQMPELDGYSATQAIRAWGGGFTRLPIVALTASAMAEDRQRCLDAGMNDFLSKPLMLPALAQALSRWAPDLLDAPSFPHPP